MIQNFSRLDRASRQIARAVLRSELRADLLSEVSKIMVECAGFAMAVVAIHDAASHQLLPVAQYGDENGYLERIRIFGDERPEGMGPAGTAFREGKAIWANDFVNDPCTKVWADEAIVSGWRAAAAIPISVAGTAVGILAVYASEVGFFGDDEQELLEQVALDVGYALDTIKQRRRQRLLEKALESSDECVGITDADGHFEYVNAAFSRTYGYRENELLGQPLEKIRSPRNSPELVTAVNEAVRKGGWRGEILNQTKDGKHFLCQGTIIPSFDEQGKIVALIRLTRDISTDRAQQEHLLLLETAVSRINDVVLITEAEPIDAPNGPKIVWVNDAFTRRTGYSLDEVIGKTPRILQGPKTQRAELDRIRRAMAEWSPSRSELINYTKSGDEFWLELDIVPVANESGWFTHWIAVERDITERKVLEEERTRLEAQLAQAQKMESIGRLAGGIAHDFNNMLTVILGYARLAMQKVAPADPLQRYLGQIEKAGERSKDITEKLLGFSRQQVIAPVPANLNDLVADLIEALELLIGEDIELSFCPGKDLWTVAVDASQVNQILLNLVVNSREAMKSGGKLTIETQNARISEQYCRTHPEAIPGAFVALTVSDTGPGIAPDVLPRIFEPFFTTKGKDRGTGLGLSLVYGIARQNGGFVNVYSEPVQGTAFRIYIPRIAGEPEVLAESGASALAKVGTGTVLVVEDDPLVCDLVTLSLESLGYTPLIANSPDHAIELCSSSDGSRIDLVLTDVVMPGMNGMELRDRIWALRPGLRVLFMSGYTSNVIVKHGILKPGVQFIAKPFTPDELSRRIWEVLNA